MQFLFTTRPIILNTAVTACLLISVSSSAQQFSKDYHKAADTYFSKGDYASAVTYYEKFLNGGASKQGEFGPYTATMASRTAPAADKSQAMYHLAESWRLLKNYVNAAPLYAQLLEHHQVYPLVQYHYATSLRALGKYSEAEAALKIFLGTYTADDTYKAAAQREVNNLRYIQEQLKKETTAFTIQPISGGRVGASYAPVQLSPDTLLFTATWPDSGAKANKVHLNRLYKAGYANGTIQAAGRTSGFPSDQLHEGAATISEDGNTLYLTKWAVNKDKKAASIYISKKTMHADGVQWTTPQALDTIVNTPGANSQQPFLMPGGKQLLYASDRTGGQGGYDLWIAELNAEGTPVNTINLGASLNTGFNEQAPYYHAGSATLVFATDGRTGMGGYDFFYAQGVPGNWSQPENFGYPVNSIKDDMYFTSYSKDKKILEHVVLSSDRSDVCCLELFRLQKKEPIVETVVSVPVPVVEKPVVVEEAVKVLDHVYYEFAKADVKPVSYPALDEVVVFLKSRPELQVEIGGHTDDKGAESLNQKLSEARAANVVAYLVSKGIDKTRLTAKGYGATLPLAPNKNEDGSDNPQGREKNRRTEMKILK